MKFINVFLKNLIYRALSFFNFGGVVVLMYHSIGDNPEFSTVRPLDFERQMKYLAQNGFNLIKLSELAGRLKNQQNFPPKTVCLTFDDGYEDNFLNVLPVLKKYNFPAAIFVSTAYIGRNFITKRRVAIKVLSVERIKEMDGSGLVEFGSHSHNHLRLIKLGDEALIKELETSKEILGEILNKDVGSLTYPKGKFDERVEEIAKNRFEIIGTVKRGRVKPGDKIWRLKRNSIDREVTFPQFKGIIKFGRI